MKVILESQVFGVATEILCAHTAVVEVFREHKKTCRITSATGGTHGPKSLHYRGYALDYGLAHIEEQYIRESIYRGILDALPSGDFDVVLEPTHIHVEYDPKKGLNQ